MSFLIKKKVGFFGGTFDPIHFGHLNLSIALKEHYHLDEVIFCPASISPFKEKHPPVASSNCRKEMVRLAIEPIQSFSFIEHELSRKEPSYTIDTLRALIQDREDLKEWHLILGEDTLTDFSLWKEAEELVSLAPPLVGSRTGFIDSSDTLPLFLEKAARRGMVKIPLMEISSTMVRERIKKGLYCGHLVPAKVLDYIYQKQLYSKA